MLLRTVQASRSTLRRHGTPNTALCLVNPSKALSENRSVKSQLQRPAFAPSVRKGLMELSKRQGVSPRHTAKQFLPSASAAQPASSSSDSKLAPVLTVVILAGLGAFSFGYHLGVVNGPLAAIAADLGFAGNTNLQGLVVSSVLAGATVGSLSGSGLADSLGRRKTFLLDAIPLAIGSYLCATASSLQTMLAGRLLVGVGIGLSSALVPLYISEVSPTNVRGALGSVNQLLICVGILAALVVNVYVPATSWRTMFYIATVPAILLGIGFLFAPESPRWLYSKGKVAEAERNAEKLWGPSGPAELGESGDGKDSAPKDQNVSLGELLGNRGVLVGCMMFLLQQFSGINAIVYFSSSVFAQAGIQSGQLASAAVGATNVIGSAVAGALVDKRGRKQLLTLSFTGMGAAMLAMSAGLGLPQLAGLSGPIALVGTLAYVLSFALGAGPVPGLLVPEITPSRMRGKAVSLALTTHWICNFALGQFFLSAVTNYGVPAVYLFFAAVCFATVAFSNRMVVETKGRSLEDIERAMSAPA